MKESFNPDIINSTEILLVFRRYQSNYIFNLYFYSSNGDQNIFFKEKITPNKKKKKTP